MTQELRLITNRPGLSAIAYRIGTHGRFKRQLLEQISRQPALRGLSTRSDDDFAIALLDAWSTAADVITFYQERLASESYLRTATERLSLGQLARLIGYELGPGVAASAPLVFTVDAVSTRGELVVIDPGVKVQSIPGPGEQPQTFETSERVTARAAFNEIRAARASLDALPTHSATFTATRADITGLNGLLPLLFVDQSERGTSVFRRIIRTYLVQEDGPRLIVSWRGADLEVAPNSTVFVIGRRALIRAVRPELQIDGVTITLDLGINVLPVDLPFVLERTSGDEPIIPSLAVGRQAGIELSFEVDRDTHTAADFGPDRAVLLPTFSATASITSRYLVRGAVRTGDVIMGALESDRTAWRAAPVDVAIPRSDLGATEIVISRWSGPNRIPPLGSERFFVFRQKGAVFGNNAPDANTIEFKTNDLFVGDPPNREWKGFGLADTSPEEIDLDGLYTGLNVGDHLLLRQRILTQLGNQNVESFIARRGTITAVNTPTRAAFGVTSRINQLTLSDVNGNNINVFLRRNAEVHMSPEELTLLGPPRTDPVEGSLIDLAGALPDLAPGRLLLLAGTLNDAPATAIELASITAVSVVGSTTTILLSASLQNSYRRDSVVIRGNVARSTHGETVSEVLGNGDASQALQRFVLKQTPLTFVSAATASGRASTLQIDVDGQAYHEVESFEGSGPRDHVYLLALGEGGTAAVQFGDGIRGARLPTGIGNVRAVYRRGIGLIGQVRADKLSLLTTPLLGVTSVVNPLPAAGAANPEDLDDARRNAPLQVRTLGRVVSLSDYEDFARAFVGVAKAHAVAFNDGPRPGVLVTVAGLNGATIEPGSDTATNLLAALRANGDPFVTARLHSFTAALFTIAGSVTAAPDRDLTILRAAVNAALLRRFGFDAGDFARPVFKSEVIAAIQAVPGVVAVHLTAFDRVDATKPDPTTIRLLARSASSPTDPPTEMLTIDPRALDNLEVAR